MLEVQDHDASLLLLLAILSHHHHLLLCLLGESRQDAPLPHHLVCDTELNVGAVSLNVPPPAADVLDQLLGERHNTLLRGSLLLGPRRESVRCLQVSVDHVEKIGAVVAVIEGGRHWVELGVLADGEEVLVARGVGADLDVVVERELLETPAVIQHSLGAGKHMLRATHESHLHRILLGEALAHEVASVVGVHRTRRDNREGDAELEREPLRLEDVEDVGLYLHIFGDDLLVLVSKDTHGADVTDEDDRLPRELPLKCLNLGELLVDEVHVLPGRNLELLGIVEVELGRGEERAEDRVVVACGCSDDDDHRLVHHLLPDEHRQEHELA